MAEISRPKGGVTVSTSTKHSCVIAQSEIHFEVVCFWSSSNEVVKWRAENETINKIIKSECLYHWLFPNVTSRSKRTLQWGHASQKCHFCLFKWTLCCMLWKMFTYYKPILLAFVFITNKFWFCGWISWLFSCSILTKWDVRWNNHFQ